MRLVHPKCRWAPLVCASDAPQQERTAFACRLAGVRLQSGFCYAAAVTVVCSLQVTVHLKGHTECFECQPKSAPKSYPVCTIRNTPDKPIHCVVWAKDLLFPRLFGRCALQTLDPGNGGMADQPAHNELYENGGTVCHPGEV